jgi:hypothetical protein
MEMFARARIYDDGVQGWAHQGTVEVAYKNPGWVEAALPIFIEALGDPEANPNNAYQQFNYIVQQNPKLAERTLPIARAYLSDEDHRIRSKALMDVEYIMKMRPELVDEVLLVQVAAMAAKDEEEHLREDAADVLKEFAKKHPRRANDLQPNKRLLQVTARLRAVVLAVAGQ